MVSGSQLPKLWPERESCQKLSQCRNGYKVEVQVHVSTQGCTCLQRTVHRLGHVYISRTAKLLFFWIFYFPFPNSLTSHTLKRPKSHQIIPVSFCLLISCIFLQKLVLFGWLAGWFWLKLLGFLLCELLYDPRGPGHYHLFHEAFLNFGQCPCRPYLSAHGSLYRCV